MKKEQRDVYITSDGTVFTDPMKAQKYELDYRLVNNLNITAVNVKTVILDNMTNLRTVLNEVLGD